MSDIKQGESVSMDATTAASAAPSAKGKSTKTKGKACEKSSEEKASSAPSTKGQKNMYGGPYRADHPSTDPASIATPFDSSKSELDGHALKKPKQRK